MFINSNNSFTEFTGKYVQFDTVSNSNQEGLYIGSWKDNHFTYLTFDHVEKSAKIEHIERNFITNISQARDLTNDERNQFSFYFVS
jgi:hypothetical protein